MYATVQISVPPVSRLAVPKKSVVTYGEQTLVFLRKPGVGDSSTIERWPVMVDMATPGDLAAVLHGLRRGDEVVADGADRLADML
jgi:multidrug efflux pump subunit AcrA (membrane-fusion protein)